MASDRVERVRSAGRAAVARVRPGRLRTRLFAILGMVVWKVGKRYARRRLARVGLRPGRGSA